MEGDGQLGCLPLLMCGAAVCHCRMSTLYSYDSEVDGSLDFSSWAAFTASALEVRSAGSWLRRLPGPRLLLARAPAEAAASWAPLLRMAWGCDGSNHHSPGCCCPTTLSICRCR